MILKPDLYRCLVGYKLAGILSNIKVGQHEKNGEGPYEILDNAVRRVTYLQPYLLP